MNAFFPGMFKPTLLHSFKRSISALTAIMHRGEAGAFTVEAKAYIERQPKLQQAAGPHSAQLSFWESATVLEPPVAGRLE